MSATTQIGRFYYRVPIDFYGDHPEQFDRDSIDEVVLDRLNAALPDGCVLCRSGELYGPPGISNSQLLAILTDTRDSLDIDQIAADHPRRKLDTEVLTQATARAVRQALTEYAVSVSQWSRESGTPVPTLRRHLRSGKFSVGELLCLGELTHTSAADLLKEATDQARTASAREPANA